jgi:unsaturated rhamnogalacturonyl hydrolase
MDAKLASGYLITKSDACPPALSALHLHRETCDAKYQPPIDDTLHYLYDVAPRTPEGAVSHLGTFTAFGTTVWIDSLYMIGQFLIRHGEWMNDARALDFYAVQFKFDIDHLQGPSGFFTHAWAWPGEQTPNTYWARGNGWVLASGADYLRARANRGESDQAVKDGFIKLMNAVVQSQDAATGLWWTILNRPGDTYLETSASALFALGLARARRAGIAGAEVLPVIAKAMTGVRSKIAMDGQGRPYVTGISAETDVGTFQDYASVPLVDDRNFGVGAVVLALLEVSGLR